MAVNASDAWHQTRVLRVALLVLVAVVRLMEQRVVRSLPLEEPASPADDDEDGEQQEPDGNRQQNDPPVDSLLLQRAVRISVRRNRGEVVLEIFDDSLMGVDLNVPTRSDRDVFNAFEVLNKLITRSHLSLCRTPEKV